jgi:hypothetical protein
MTRTTLEALYRRYFLEIRKFDPFPMQLTYDNVMDFAEWLEAQGEQKEPTIEDGFGSVWSQKCPECGHLSMEVVRPGKVQCGNCG